MRKYGLIGRHLGHSFSPDYFKKKFETLGLTDIEYHAYPLEKIDEVSSLMEKGIDGLNVTIPYKESVMQYLSYIDVAASEIGAVNCIKKTDIGYTGFNTDWIGFKQSLQAFIPPNAKMNALVLGYGGAAKAICYALSDLLLPYTVVSRKEGHLHYDQLTTNDYNLHHLLINTTSLGMYPDVESRPLLDYTQLTDAHFLYDIVYNPEQTAFLKEGQKRGAKTKNGHDMLILQAEESWRIWNA